MLMKRFNVQGYCIDPVLHGKLCSEKKYNEISLFLFFNIDGGLNEKDCVRFNFISICI